MKVSKILLANTLLLTTVACWYPGERLVEGGKKFGNFILSYLNNESGLKLEYDIKFDNKDDDKEENVIELKSKLTPLLKEYINSNDDEARKTKMTEIDNILIKSKATANIKVAEGDPTLFGKKPEVEPEDGQPKTTQSSEESEAKKDDDSNWTAMSYAKVIGGSAIVLALVGFGYMQFTKQEEDSVDL